MKEMGIAYPVVAFDSPLEKDVKVPNPNYVPPAGLMPGESGGGPPGSPEEMGGGGGSAGASMSLGPEGGGFGSGGISGGGSGLPATKEDDVEVVPAFKLVDLYTFTVQFSWKETLLNERLEKQVSDWETEKQNAPDTTPPADEADLAANLKGGA